MIWKPFVLICTMIYIVLSFVFSGKVLIEVKSYNLPTASELLHHRLKVQTEHGSGN
ncbi:uncharacterized protein BO80DRAFT_141801 [Aspergillus ibericus CBS 121593]|uniref:Uncharacterized protein n=1 Tax=Aspergillus ibericus CBS 121593 TaxID=1448316 RepID=A0A395GW41_9EURO|nr:hypothetical protein BO80DRAFT_141801 [Aspergillus ibericus CBS 121593]RAK99238.1 hypothetical protein BO80DRAFT_141801 [Aspergillus ibericus CBS 121593]